MKIIMLTLNFFFNLSALCSKISFFTPVHTLFSWRWKIEEKLKIGNKLKLNKNYQYTIFRLLKNIISRQNYYSHFKAIELLTNTAYHKNTLKIIELSLKFNMIERAQKALKTTETGISFKHFNYLLFFWNLSKFIEKIPFKDDLKNYLKLCSLVKM